MITQTEKQDLQKALTQAFNDFISTVSSIDDSNINRIPFAGSWTPAQVATHIILATDGVPDGTTQPSGRDAGALLQAIRPWWEDLNQKFQSPEPLRPDNKPRGKQDLLSELQRVREKDLSILLHQDLSLLCMDFALPNIGYLTRYEWLWFIEMHVKRHLFQLQNMGYLSR
jgi:hypothetical protein